MRVDGHGGNDSIATGSNPSAYVDIYNSTSASWTRLPEGLGQARGYLAAVALSSGLVIFAGGLTGDTRAASIPTFSTLLLGGEQCSATMICLKYMHEIYAEMWGNFVDTSASGVAMRSAYVDLYDVTKKSWSRYPSGLGQARSSLAAASLPSGLVFFGGGVSAGSLH